MRIVAGKLRGRSLATVGKGDVGAHLRPTTDRTRESLFNILTGGKFDLEIDGARVLDLFAGTGALGLEALSRGAVNAVFIDSGRPAQKLIRQNIAMLGVKERARVLGCDATRLPDADEEADLIFLDPPYGKALAEPALLGALQRGWIGPESLIVVEENASLTLDGLTVLDARKMGDTWLTFLKPS